MAAAVVQRSVRWLLVASCRTAGRFVFVGAFIQEKLKASYGSVSPVSGLHNGYPISREPQPETLKADDDYSTITPYYGYLTS